MTPRRSWPCFALLTLLTGALGSPSLLPGDASFEADGAGFFLRTGQLEPALHKAAIEPGKAADGRRSARLTAHSPRPEVEVQSGWVQLEAGVEYHLTAYVCTDRVGLQAVFAAVGLDGDRREVVFGPTEDWRRYDAAFTIDQPGWRYLAIGPAGGEAVHDPGSIYVDAVRLDAGPAQPFEPEPVLGATLLGSPGLRRAGDRADFELRLVSPQDAPEVVVRWRFEDPFGQVRDLGSRQVELQAGEAAEMRVRLDRLRPGAYRLLAAADLDGRRVEADATVVAVSWELGGPEPWFGVTGAWGGRALSTLELMRIGIERGMVPIEAADVPFGPLYARRRAKVTSVGFLPADGDSQSVADRAARFRGLIKGWELPPVRELSIEAEARRIAAAAAGLREADRGALGLLLRVPADPDGLARMSALLSQLDDPGDAVVLVLGDGEPESVGVVGTRTIVAAAKERVAGRSLEVGVVAPGWAAEPWDSSLTPAPHQPGEPLRLSALEQASRLVRSMILAKAGGADWYLYPGAPLADRPPHLTMLQLGRTADGYAADGTPLPFAAAVDHALDVLRNRQLAELIQVGHGLLCLRFHERRPLAILWRPGQDGVLDLKLPAERGRLEVTDLFGQPVVVRGSADATYLSVGRHPLYLESTGLDSTAFAKALAGAIVLGS